MRKRILELVVLFLSFTVFILRANNIQYTEEIEQKEQIFNTNTIEKYNILQHSNLDTEEDIRNEILYGELELVAQLIQAEAGNQDEMGKRYVADCVLNRVDNKNFPDDIESVIYQKDPIQFACTVDGNYDKAAWTVTEDCFKIALEEYENRTNSEILYFRTDKYGTGTPVFKYGDHYFSK